MSHEEFLAAYASGKVRVRVDRDGAARLLSARLMLPLLLPLLGLAVVLALTGALALGAGLFLLVLALRYAVRASGQGLVLSRALHSPAFYEEALAAGILSVE